MMNTKLENLNIRWSPLLAVQIPHSENLPDEEELMRLLPFAPLKRITEFTCSKYSEFCSNPLCTVQTSTQLCRIFGPSWSFLRSLFHLNQLHHMSVFEEMDLHYPTQKLRTPLTTAIDRGDADILKTLLDVYPVSLDSTATQPCGKTALMHASYVTRNEDVLGVLIERGADVRKTDIRGWNCLYYGIVAERIGIVKKLLESGVDVNSQDNQGRTPLIIAVILSNLGTTKVLLDHGANTEATDNSGYTALRLAILRKKQEQALLLVESGCGVTCIPSTSTYSDYELAKHLMPHLGSVIRLKNNVTNATMTELY